MKTAPKYMRRDRSLATLLEVVVSSEDDAEMRRVSITNHGSRTREIQVTSYAEICLTSQAADCGASGVFKFVRRDGIRGRTRRATGDSPQAIRRGGDRLARARHRCRGRSDWRSGI